LFEYSYQQTSASVADIASEVSSLRHQIRLAELYIPIGLLGAAALSLVVGSALTLRRRWADPDAPMAGTDPRPAPGTKRRVEE
jgi:hypothetical protein